ncbi:MAG: protein-ADP-ribose hydrolase [Oscillospiraceae bacterium]|nr:protein-ADP-ribose hydrolase [Oscillospiraceae bacterium]
MNKLEQVKELNHMLLAEMPEYRLQANRLDAEDYKEQRMLLRSLMNLRNPMPVSQYFLDLQDEFLQEETEEKGIVHVSELLGTAEDNRLCIWQGDITRLDADAIVNAANAALLGCFIPCHKCIDNAIHSAAGVQLRDVCFQMMQKQGHEEATGSAKITKGYNLPAKYVIHTVGPVIYDEVTAEDKIMLASCYASCLQVAAEKNLESIAFCCISTGEFHFPNELAAEIAVDTVQAYLNQNSDTSLKKVIFNVFKDLDKRIYENLLEG